MSEHEFNIINGIIYIFISALVLFALFVIRNALGIAPLIDRIFIVSVFGICAFVFVIIVLIIVELKKKD